MIPSCKIGKVADKYTLMNEATKTYESVTLTPILICTNCRPCLIEFL